MNVDITILLDRSGSMSSCRSETIGGFNHFVNEQRKERASTCKLSLVQFDDQYEVNYVEADVNEEQVLLNEDKYIPRGMTAYYDALCRLIDDTGKRLASMSVKPEKVIFVVLTDGMNNASHSFTKEDAQKRVRHQEGVYKWEFIFIGASLNASLDEVNVGVLNKGGLISAGKSPRAQAGLYAGLAANVRGVRTGEKSNLNWTAQQKNLQDEELLKEGATYNNKE